MKEIDSSTLATKSIFSSIFANRHSLIKGTVMEFSFLNKFWYYRKVVCEVKACTILCCVYMHGCHRSGNGQGKKFFKVRKKSGNFTFSQGKIKCLKEVRKKWILVSLFFSLYFYCFLTLKFSYIFYRHESCCIGRILFMKLDD